MKYTGLSVGAAVNALMPSVGCRSPYHGATSIQYHFRLYYILHSFYHTRGNLDVPIIKKVHDALSIAMMSIAADRIRDFLARLPYTV